MSLGTRIRELRKKRKINQEQLGKILSVSKASISGYENGTREPDTKSLMKLAQYFGVTVDYLLGVDATPEWATAKDTHDLHEFLDANEGSMTYDGEHLTEDEKQQLRVATATIFWKRHQHK
ncbi:helix-turn-helix domain-containing protein [Lactiplantibacillus modestisalitolerans]|uniref:Helix-turn-helix domain-containing protein n=1 Tax=Lactiplantibacillus modestisalitolerans TaxID=1457219 RepID=A0ABV5WVE3_9LACO|nr:helix-turn-helix transcriptional regulator [Lactiplantibacillus modestisalitolerans]